MKKNFSKIICVLLCAALLALCGCAKKPKYDFSRSLFIESTVMPVYGALDEMYTTTISVYADGTVFVSAAPYSDNLLPGAAPRVTVERTLDEVSALQQQLIKAGCFELPEDVETDSQDGAYHTITVYTEQQEFVSSGLNPSDKRFAAVEKLIRDFAGDAAIAELDSLMRDYLAQAAEPVA